MTTKIWIPEFEAANCEDPEVEFLSGVGDYQEEEKETNTPESVVFEGIAWNKSKYTEKQNKIIDRYVPHAEKVFEDMFFSLPELDF